MGPGADEETMRKVSPYAVGGLVVGAMFIGIAFMASLLQRPEAAIPVGCLGLPLLVLGWRGWGRVERREDHVAHVKASASLLLNKLPAGMLLLDAHDNVLFANEQARRLFGLNLKTWSGQTLDSLTDAKAHETDAGLGCLRRFRRGDGRLLYAHVSEAPVEVPGQAEDGSLRILVVSDVTALVELQRQIQQSERLRTAATMASQFAHEVRNPVAAISGSAQVLEKLQHLGRPGDDASAISEQERSLLYQCIVHESDRLDGIIAKFLSVADFSDERLAQMLQEAAPAGGLPASSPPLGPAA